MSKNYNLSIAKQKYTRSRSEIKLKISHQDFIDVIESRGDYFNWLENTDKGKNTLSHLDKIPEAFRENILKGHNKIQACAEYNLKKGYHEFLLDYIDLYGSVSITIMSKITDNYLQILINIAESLNAHLLNNGTEVINKNTLINLT